MRPESPEVNEALEGVGLDKRPSDFAGQPLFVHRDDWQNNAMLGWTGFPWDAYSAGYKDGADVLVKALLEGKASLDTVIYPLVFLYRQGLELQLKLILPLARRLAGKEKRNDRTHALEPMWVELHELLDELDPRDGDKELLAIHDFFRQFEAVDSGSFAFRYPTDKKGEPLLPDLRTINVRHLAKIMDSVFMTLSGIYSYLGEREQYAGDH